MTNAPEVCQETETGFMHKFQVEQILVSSTKSSI